MEINVNVSVDNFNATSMKYSVATEIIKEKEKPDYKPPTSTGINIFCINFDE